MAEIAEVPIPVVSTPSLPEAGPSPVSSGGAKPGGGFEAMTSTPGSGEYTEGWQQAVQANAAPAELQNVRDNLNEEIARVTNQGPQEPHVEGIVGQGTQGPAESDEAQPAGSDSITSEPPEHGLAAEERGEHWFEEGKRETRENLREEKAKEWAREPRNYEYASEGLYEDSELTRIMEEVTLDPENQGKSYKDLYTLATQAFEKQYPGVIKEYAKRRQEALGYGKLSKDLEYDDMYAQAVRRADKMVLAREAIRKFSNLSRKETSKAREKDEQIRRDHVSGAVKEWIKSNSSKAELYRKGRSSKLFNKMYDEFIKEKEKESSMVSQNEVPQKEQVDSEAAIDKETEELVLSTSEVPQRKESKVSSTPEVQKETTDITPESAQPSPEMQQTETVQAVQPTKTPEQAQVQESSSTESQRPKQEVKTGENLGEKAYGEIKDVFGDEDFSKLGTGQIMDRMSKERNWTLDSATIDFAESGKKYAASETTPTVQEPEQARPSEAGQAGSEIKQGDQNEEATARMFDEEEANRKAENEEIIRLREQVQKLNQEVQDLTNVVKKLAQAQNETNPEKKKSLLEEILKYFGIAVMAATVGAGAIGSAAKETR